MTVIDKPALLATVEPGRSECFIPTPCGQNHASFIHVLPDGALGCVWFGGTQEGIPDISVHLSRLEAGATRWSAAEKLSDDPTRSEQNPLLFTTPSGALWLLWTAQLGGNQDTALIRRRVSHDSGRTWNAVEEMIPEKPGFGTFIRSRIVVNPRGEWLLPIWRCTKPPEGAWTGNLDTSSVLISADEGKTWRESAVPGSTGCVHMSIVPHGAALVALYRSRWADNVYRSVSHDGGETWSAPQPTELPNNNSSVMALTLASGAIALMYNESSAADATGRRASLYDDIGGAEVVASMSREAFWGAPRAPMSIALSHDGGITWPHRRNLEVGDGFCMTNNSKDKLNREFSYPSLCQSADGALHLAYTYWRQAIKYVRTDENWIKA